MPCDTYRQSGQTLEQRKQQVRETIARLNSDLMRRKVKVKVGPQGAVTFEGFENRNGVTDACAYRRIMATGSALARAEIARAEQIAGRSIDRQIVASGIHSHDGGLTWDNKG